MNAIKGRIPSDPPEQPALDWDAVRGRTAEIVKMHGSQGAAAKAAGIDQGNISKFLNRKQDTMQVAVCDALARSVKRSTNWLLYGAAPELPDHDSGTLRLIPWHSLTPSPLNPRKQFEPEALQDLANALLAQARDGGSGILQNLVARPHPTAAGKFEIAAGERRYRAAGLNIEAGHYGADIAIPAQIRGLSDAELLGIALSENRDRRDVHPMDEARGYKALQDLLRAEFGTDVPAATIAERTKADKRVIQLRLELVDKLHPDVQAALEADRLSLAQARALTAAPHEFQINAVQLIAQNHYDYRTAEQIKTALKRSLIPVGLNFFPLDAWTGLIRTIEDKDYFEDRALFDTMQAAAIEAKEKALAEKWGGGVIVHDNSSKGSRHFDDWPKTQDKATGCAIIQIDYSGRVTVIEGRVKPTEPAKLTAALPAPAKDGDGPAEAPRDLCTKGHLIHARKRKTEAMQDALAQDPHLAMRAVILALLGGTDAVKIKREEKCADDDIAATRPAATIEKYRTRLALPVDRYSRDRISSDNEGTAWRRIMGLTVAETKELFAALVALRIGSHNEYHTDFGDRPGSLAIAHTLGLVGDEAGRGLTLRAGGGERPGDLDGLRTFGYERAGAEIGLQSIPGTGKKIREAIEIRAGLTDCPQADIERRRDYVLPTLRFGTPDAVKAAFATGAKIPAPKPDDVPDPASAVAPATDRSESTDGDANAVRGAVFTRALFAVCGHIGGRVSARPAHNPTLCIHDLLDDLQFSDVIRALEIEAGDVDMTEAEREAMTTLGDLADWLAPHLQGEDAGR
ncbi:ParB/RepB/Spo0J family partition protein [Pacificispira sp.]|uniref:ParB/RepB/Spo0J family partition protein n=1 Tax=Pacificispira sp. TaxID=2888761 RepID=UPI003BAC882D